MNTSMYKVKCANPECKKGVLELPKEGYVYGVDKAGTIPDWYCCKACEGQINYQKRFK